MDLNWTPISTPKSTKTHSAVIQKTNPTNKTHYRYTKPYLVKLLKPGKLRKNNDVNLKKIDTLERWQGCKTWKYSVHDGDDPGDLNTVH